MLFRLLFLAGFLKRQSEENNCRFECDMLHYGAIVPVINMLGELVDKVSSCFPIRNQEGVSTPRNDLIIRNIND